jgi:hypothetical protein
MVGDLFHAYQKAVTQFELANDAVLEALAADEIPSAELFAAEEDARTLVVSARTLLLAELERVRAADVTRTSVRPGS